MRRRNPTTIVVVLSMCGIVVSLQQTSMVPLLHELPGLLGTSADSASWLVTATLLTGAVATPIISRLADMYGKRRMIVASLVFSLLGSLLGALSEPLPLLVAARALQGVGLALIPVAIAMMRDELPHDRVPLGVAIMSATLAIGAAAGLPMAGIIANHLDWHAIFWLTAVVAFLLLLAATALLPESPVRTRGSFDLRGAVLLSASLTAILLALSKGSQWGWTSATTVGILIAGLALFALWMPLELATPSPLVDLRVAGRRAVLLVNLVSVFAGFAMFANMLVTVQYLQMPVSSGYGLGLDVLHAGLWMVPNAATFGLLAPASAWLTRRVGPQVTLLTGTLVMAVAYALRVPLSDDLVQIVGGSVLVGSGSALVYGAIPTLIMRAVPVTETASANGLNVLLRSIGTASASATIATISTASMAVVAGQSAPTRDALSLMLWLATAASLAAAALAVPTLRMRAYSREWDRAGAERTGSDTEVVRGQVLAPNAHPVRSAVVTILMLDGTAVDWSQCDSEGRFSVAIPRAGQYLVVTGAEGWQPRSRIMDLDGNGPLPPIVLQQRYRLTGVITGSHDDAVIDALVVLTRFSGEVVVTTTTDHEGRYEVPRPPDGRYVLTVSATDGSVGARPASVWEMMRSLDLKLGTPLVADPGRSTPSAR